MFKVGDRVRIAEKRLISYNKIGKISSIGVNYYDRRRYEIYFDVNDKVSIGYYEQKEFRLIPNMFEIWSKA